MCVKLGTIVMANNDLARGGGTYETPYTLKLLRNMNLVYDVTSDFQ